MGRGAAPLSMLLLRNENLQNLLKRTKEAAAAYIDTTDSPKLKGLTVAQLFGLEWESAPREQLNWRSRMNALFKGLDQYGIGLLITVDEVSASLDEMISIAATYQLFVREGKRVGLPMAGLPHQVSALLRNQTVSFLRRSIQVQSGVALAQGDLAFLRAMLEDQDVSLVADIAQRMGVASNYASQYRARMVEQGIIGTRGRGKVAFDMPHFKEFLLSKFAEA